MEAPVAPAEPLPIPPPRSINFVEASNRTFPPGLITFIIAEGVARVQDHREQRRREARHGAATRLAEAAAPAEPPVVSDAAATVAPGGAPPQAGEAREGSPGSGTPAATSRRPRPGIPPPPPPLSLWMRAPVWRAVRCLAKSSGVLPKLRTDTGIPRPVMRVAAPRQGLR